MMSVGIICDNMLERLYAHEERAGEIIIPLTDYYFFTANYNHTFTVCLL